MRIKAQSALEYLLITAAVIIVLLLSFRYITSTVQSIKESQEKLEKFVYEQIIASL